MGSGSRWSGGVRQLVVELERTDPELLPLVAGHLAALRATGAALDAAGGELQAAMVREHRLLLSEVVKLAEVRRGERERQFDDAVDSFEARFEALVEQERGDDDGG